MSRRALAAAVLLGLVAACGPPARPALPSGAGTPFAEFASAYDEAVADCHAVQTITAELSLSGRAGTTKLRGRISAGLASPADIVLEGQEAHNSIADQLLKDERIMAAMQGMLATMVYKAFRNRSNQSRP